MNEVEQLKKGLMANVKDEVGQLKEDSMAEGETGRLLQDLKELGSTSDKLRKDVQQYSETALEPTSKVK